MLAVERVESERLRKIIRELQRHRFVRRAESPPLSQLQLGLEEAEQAEAADEALAEAVAATVRAARTVKRWADRGSLPAHLPRIETVVNIADDSCPCYSAPLNCIGEDVSERLNVVPAQFRVMVVRRPKYACRACTDGVAQASAPARVIEGGLPTDATVAQVLVSRYTDCLPLYRQAQSRQVQSHACVSLDTNHYSVPWRLIGAQVTVEVSDGQVRISHAGAEVACHALRLGRRERAVERAHLHGVVPDEREKRGPVEADPAIAVAPPEIALLRSLAEYEQLAGGGW